MEVITRLKKPGIWLPYILGGISPRYNNQKEYHNVTKFKDGFPWMPSS